MIRWPDPAQSTSYSASCRFLWSEPKIWLCSSYKMYKIVKNLSFTYWYDINVRLYHYENLVIVQKNSIYDRGLLKRSFQFTSYIYNNLVKIVFKSEINRSLSNNSYCFSWYDKYMCRRECGLAPTDITLYRPPVQ